MDIKANNPPVHKGTAIAYNNDRLVVFQMLCLFDFAFLIAMYTPVKMEANKTSIAVTSNFTIMTGSLT
ncbi:hypothetical protein D3C72_2025030 [compost metagenome]